MAGAPRARIACSRSTCCRVWYLICAAPSGRRSRIDVELLAPEGLARADEGGDRDCGCGGHACARRRDGARRWIVIGLAIGSSGASRSACVKPLTSTSY